MGGCTIKIGLWGFVGLALVKRERDECRVSSRNKNEDFDLKTIVCVKYL